MTLIDTFELITPAGRLVRVRRATRAERLCAVLSLAAVSAVSAALWVLIGLTLWRGIAG